MNEIAFSLFQNFVTSESGGALNIKTIDTNVKSCEFLYCTATKYGACFLFTSCNSNISNSCFFHSQIITKQNSYFGNAFFIDTSPLLTKFECISAYECGYDQSKVGDTTFVTKSLSLEANNINNSNCAAYEGGCFCFEWNSVTNISFITCISVYGELTCGIVVSKGNCYINYINFIQSPNLGCTFWLDDIAQVYIQNGIFYDVFSSSFSSGNKYSNFHLDNCFCNVQISSLSNMKLLNTLSIFQFNTIIKAEICMHRNKLLNNNNCFLTCLCNSKIKISLINIFNAVLIF